MTDFASARSGLYAGVILGAGAWMLCGGVALVAAVDAIQSLFSPWGVSVTSVGVAGGGFVAATLFGLLGFFSLRTLLRWQRIDRRPVMAWGTMGEPRRTNSRVNRRVLFKIPLTVVPPQGTAYAAVAKWFLPGDLRERARPGARVVVRIDPENAKVVLVDWDQTRTTWGMPPPPE
ncbi:MAG: hypothetical protein IT377_15410 [Polyangiaceae bacterium]|nr:hypothetical protein [Polyangiaceae bacterium]